MTNVNESLKNGNNGVADHGNILASKHRADNRIIFRPLSYSYALATAGDAPRLDTSISHR
jgi:hypothetical protein